MSDKLEAMRYLTLISCFAVFFGCKAYQDNIVKSTIADDSDEFFVVAFGSCNKHDKVNPFWDDILAQKPDVWIWGGDNIYADTDNMGKMKSMYTKQNRVAGYKALKSQVPVIGTWDDHDYGLNDGGKEFSMKKESQQLFLDFMEVPKGSDRRKRDGVYASHLFETNFGKVNILVLDTRYFRSVLKKDEDPNRRYKPNAEAESTILGAEQWNWLKNELETSEADFNLIVTSIQLLSHEHGFESWGNFPMEMEKMKDLIAGSGAKGVMVLSGDRHISEFSRIALKGMDYPLVDFTSSGLTHSYAEFKSESNKNRIGEVVSKKSFGLIRLNLNEKKVRFTIMGENGKIYRELTQRY